MTAHGAYGAQGAGGPGDAADLVRSYALSAARLWEEVLERLERVEQSQIELREAMARLRSALPPGAAVGEPVLGTAGASAALDAGEAEPQGEQEGVANAAHAARGLTAKDAVDLLFGDDPSFAEDRAEDGLVSMAAPAPPQPWESPNGTGDAEEAAQHAVDAFGESSWSLQPESNVEEPAPAARWAAGDSGGAWVLGSDEEQFGAAPPPPPQGFTGYEDIAVAVPPPPAGFETFGEAVPPPPPGFAAHDEAAPPPPPPGFETFGEAPLPPPPPPPAGFETFGEVAPAPPAGFEAGAMPPPPPPPAGFETFGETAPPPPSYQGFADLAAPPPPPPPPPPGFETPGELPTAPVPAVPPPPPAGFTGFEDLVPPPPPGFETPGAPGPAQVPAPPSPPPGFESFGDTAQPVPPPPPGFSTGGPAAPTGGAAPSQQATGAAGQETEEVPITPDFFARAGRRR